MTDYHQLWTSPSGIQSTFSAASGPPTVAMATDWLIPAEPKPGEAEKGRSRLSGLLAGCQPLPQAGSGGPSVSLGLDHHPGNRCCGESSSLMLLQVSVSLWV